MDFLRNMIANTQAHLSGLGMSQKLTLALCVVVMAGALVWMFQWTGKPEWEPVLPGQLWTEDEMEMAKKVLQEDEYRISGRQILVPADKRQSIRSRLGQSGALPSDTRKGFEALMNETSPWKSQTQQSREWVVAYGNQLAMDLEGWKGVRNAQVILQMPKRRGLGEKHTKPSASVSVGLESGTGMDRAFTQAIAHFISGSTGVPPENVQIVDTNTHRSHRIAPPGTALGDDLLEVRRQKEEYFQKKIEAHLGIPGVRVSCFAELESDRRSEIEVTPTEGKAIEQEETKEEMIESRKPVETEPGVQPNTSVALGSEGVVENSEQTSRTMKFKSDLGKIQKTTEFTMGALKKLTASINVPRSYLEAIFKRQPGNEEKPVTDQDIDKIAEREFEKVRKQVVTALGGVDDKSVDVAWFDDPMTRLAAAGGGFGPGAAGSEDSATGLIRAYGRQFGLGMLAFMSLLMMLMIVRKGPAASAKQRDRHAAFKQEKDEDLAILEAGLETVGEASQAETAMEGREVDENMIQEEQRVEQVAGFVRGDPDMAASMIRRWLGND